MLNVGLDLDGVICEWKDLPEAERTWEGYQDLNLVEGAVEGMEALFNADCDLTIVTGRHYPMAHAHIMTWLINRLPSTVSFDVIAGIPVSSKWRVLQAIGADIHVDDNPRAFNRLPFSIIGILFRGPQNAGVELPPWRAHNWPDLVEQIKFIKELKQL